MTVDSLLVGKRRAALALAGLTTAVVLLIGWPWWRSAWNALFSSNFMPHGTCYLWEPSVVWVHVISDGLIFLAYLSISSTLVYVAHKRGDLPFDWMFLMFGTFIVACGIGHALDVLMIWTPMYWLSGAERVLTAIVSVGTAITLVPLVPKVLALPSPAQLRQANEKLLMEIQERKLAEAELEKAMAKLKEQQHALLRSERLAAVGELAASVGHELRNPLSAIQNALTYVSTRVTDQACPNLEARVPQFFDLMQRELNNSNKIIASLLDYARDRAPVRQPCVLAPLVNEAIEIISTPVRIENRVPKDLPIPHLDGGQFRQVLLNLLQNAVDATPTDSREPVVVEAEGGADKPWTLKVTDKGSGIPSEALNRVFEPLFTSKVKGTGLGLAIVKKIVLAHDGQISLTSEVGQGTTISIVLPPSEGRASHASVASAE